MRPSLSNGSPNVRFQRTLHTATLPSVEYTIIIVLQRIANTHIYFRKSHILINRNWIGRKPDEEFAVWLGLQAYGKSVKLFTNFCYLHQTNSTANCYQSSLVVGTNVEAVGLRGKRFRVKLDLNFFSLNFLLQAEKRVLFDQTLSKAFCR